MKGAEKFGRITWITYLITATPIALLCAALALISIRFLFVEDVGPIEEPPLPTFQKIIFIASAICLPITWVLGYTIAHRFNGTMSRTVPFLANMLPTTGLFWFAFILARDEGGEFVWMTAYIGVLVALLAIGMIAALISARQKTQTPNKTSLLTLDPQRVQSENGDSAPNLKSEFALGQA